jgi:hypothetical protein
MMVACQLTLDKATEIVGIRMVATVQCTIKRLERCGLVMADRVQWLHAGREI